MNSVRLGVNIDHIATLRNARGVDYPCPILGAQICEQAGANGITLHLREDRRHIKDSDVYAIKNAIGIPMNLEMALTDEMLAIACDVKPDWVCLVPEKRTEITTEGGLDVALMISQQGDYLPNFIQTLQNKGIKVSLFIDPDCQQIDQSIWAGANAIELHTGAYANYHLSQNTQKTLDELDRIRQCVRHAKTQSPTLIVNAGHGLTLDNVAPIAQINGIYELNIGHSIIADSVFVGLDKAVKQMRQKLKMP